jgi:hypothetical protein
MSGYPFTEELVEQRLDAYSCLVAERRGRFRLVFLGAIAAGCLFACTESSENGGPAATGGSTSPGSTAGQGGTSNSPSGGSSAVAAGAAGYSPLGTPLPTVDCQHTGDGRTTLTIINHCQAPLQARGSNWTGASLAPGGYTCLDLGSTTDKLSSLRYWGYIGQDPGAGHYTLAEFTLNTDFNDFDWYDISHVDADNLPMAILAVDRPQCRDLSCPESALANCPAVGILRDSSGNVTSCVSPERDNASSPVAVYFDALCADAYAWSGDDAQSMVACAGEDYDVVFCP